ncbi:uncharacterized protein LOC144864009 isoform X1 [Branchiostoma floridae x Branchiostoma japonicum]
MITTRRIKLMFCAVIFFGIWIYLQEQQAVAELSMSNLLKPETSKGFIERGRRFHRRLVPRKNIGEINHRLSPFQVPSNKPRSSGLSRPLSHKAYEAKEYSPQTPLLSTHQPNKNNGRRRPRRPRGRIHHVNRTKTDNRRLSKLFVQHSEGLSNSLMFTTQSKTNIINNYSNVLEDDVLQTVGILTKKKSYFFSDDAVRTAAVDHLSYEKERRNLPGVAEELLLDMAMDSRLHRTTAKGKRTQDQIPFNFARRGSRSSTVYNQRLAKVAVKRQDMNDTDDRLQEQSNIVQKQNTPITKQQESVIKEGIESMRIAKVLVQNANFKTDSQHISKVDVENSRIRDEYSHFVPRSLPHNSRNTEKESDANINFLIHDMRTVRTNSHMKKMERDRRSSPRFPVTTSNRKETKHYQLHPVSLRNPTEVISNGSHHVNSHGLNVDDAKADLLQLRNYLRHISDKRAQSPNNTLTSFEDFFDRFFNVSRIQRMQRVTKTYYDPRRHVIRFSDYDIFMEQCEKSDFTLRNTSRPCDVVRSPIKHYRTCAVVGNSGILLNSSCGAEIDAHDFVIRSNLPPVLNFRKDVGSKTNLTLINGIRLIQVHEQLESPDPAVRENMRELLGESPGMVFSYVLYMFGSQAFDRLQFIDEVLKQYNISVILAFPHESLLRRFRAGLFAWLSGGKWWKTPSTGMNNFALASTFCDRMSLYGYYPLKTYNNRTVPYHYYDRRKPSKRHEFTEEFETLQSLHKKRLVRHVVGTCSLV